MKKSVVFAIASSLVIIVVSSTIGSPLARAGTVFRDDFNSATLDASWEIIREDPSHWSLTESPGSLRITSQKGEFFLSPKPANVFLVDQQSDFDSIETLLTFDPSQNFQQAGLIIYVDDTNYMKFDRIWSSNLPGDDVVEFFDQVTDTRRTADVSVDTLYMRISKSDNDYTASYSTDGINYIDVGILTTSALKTPKLGLFVINGASNAAEIPSDFDYFVVKSPITQVNIDVKPGNKRNVINPRANGGIWTAILSDIDTGSPFDPSSQVNISTVEFGPDGANAVRYKVKDINKDGLGDLLLRFDVPATGIACGDTEATLTGKTFDGQSITGTDSIKTVGCPKDKVIRIEAFIDGRSQLIFRGNTAQWHHFDFAAPGRHEFRNEPTIINDAIWFPVWPDVPNEENYFCDCSSDVFKPVKSTQLGKDVSVDLTLIQSRGTTEIVQYPSKENGYTLILEFDDNPINSSDNYIVELHFSKGSSKPKKQQGMHYKLNHHDGDHKEGHNKGRQKH